MKSSVSLVKRKGGFDVEQIFQLPSLGAVKRIFKGKVRGCFFCLRVSS